MSEQNQISAAKLWFVLARASSAIGTYIERSLGQQGFCLTDFMVLEALLHKGPLTITGIQGKVLLATGSMTAAVDRVENKGLVVRKSTLADRRARLLALTPKGRKLIASVYREHAADLESVVSVLNEEEKDALYRLLKKLGHFAAETLAVRQEEPTSKGRK